jgi:hypothetical protein
MKKRLPPSKPRLHEQHKVAVSILSELGYPGGITVGTAIRLFQRDYGLKRTGKPDPVTMARMRRAMQKARMTPQLRHGLAPYVPNREIVSSPAK